MQAVNGAAHEKTPSSSAVRVEHESKQSQPADDLASNHAFPSMQVQPGALLVCSGGEINDAPKMMQQRPMTRAQSRAKSAAAAASTHHSPAAAPMAASTKRIKVTRDAKEAQVLGQPPTKRARFAVAAALDLASCAQSPSRIDSDSASLCLSFLGTRDFLHMIQVSKQWKSAGVKLSAWPQLQVSTLIRALQGGNCNNSSRRRLTIATPVQAKRLRQLACMALWRHVTELKVNGSHNHPWTWLTSDPQLSLLSRVSSLELRHCSKSDEAVGELFSALTERLQALSLDLCSLVMRNQLGRLTSLRVLVLDIFPAAVAILPLKQLVYLQVGSLFPSGYPDPPLMSAVRWLSVYHQLRFLSLRFYGRNSLQELLDTDSSTRATSSVGWTSLAVQPPLDLKVKCGLTSLSIDSGGLKGTRLDMFLAGLPHLTRLQWEECHAAPFLISGEAVRTRAFLAQLQEITFLWDGGGLDTPPPLRTLLVCTQLRVLRLKMKLLPAAPVPTALMHELLAAWAPSIEQIRLQGNIRVNLGEEAEEWKHEMAACHRLRDFSLRPLHRELPTAFLIALSTLPALHSLGLIWYDDPPLVAPTLLQCMADSHSWSELHLKHFGDVKAQLKAVRMNDRTAQRLRIYVHRQYWGDGTTSFHIATVPATSNRVWQLESHTAK